MRERQRPYVELFAGAGEAMQVQSGECGLRFGMAVSGGAFKPSGAFGSARRHAGALQVEEGDPVLGVSYSSVGGAPKQRQALTRAPFVAQAYRRAQRSPRRKPQLPILPRPRRSYWRRW